MTLIKLVIFVNCFWDKVQFFRNSIRKIHRFLKNLLLHQMVILFLFILLIFGYDIQFGANNINWNMVIIGYKLVMILWFISMRKMLKFILILWLKELRRKNKKKCALDLVKLSNINKSKITTGIKLNFVQKYLSLKALFKLSIYIEIQGKLFTLNSITSRKTQIYTTILHYIHMLYYLVWGLKNCQRFCKLSCNLGFKNVCTIRNKEKFKNWLFSNFNILMTNFNIFSKIKTMLIMIMIRTFSTRTKIKLILILEYL